MARGGAEEVAEAAEHLGADGALFIIGDERAQRPLVLEDVEVVEPEPGELLFELVRGVERAQEHAGLRLAREALQVLVQRLALGLALIRRRFLQRAAATLQIGAEVGERAPGNGHLVDARLDIGRERRGRRLQLRREPAAGAEPRDLGGGGAARAPAHAVKHLELQRRRVVRPGDRLERRLARRAGAAGEDEGQCVEERAAHVARLLYAARVKTIARVCCNLLPNSDPGSQFRSPALGSAARWRLPAANMDRAWPVLGVPPSRGGAT